MTHQEPSPADLGAAVAAECERLGLVVSSDAVPGHAAYAASRWSWNERLKLTRHTDVEKFVSRDVADAAAIAPHLANGEHVLDVVERHLDELAAVLGGLERGARPLHGSGRRRR